MSRIAHWASVRSRWWREGIHGCIALGPDHAAHQLPKRCKPESSASQLVFDQKDVNRFDDHFDVVAVYGGVSVLVIHYRNQRGTLVNEVLEFAGGLVRRGHGTYLMGG